MTNCLDFDRLERIARARRHDYRSASPFPHIVLDDFFDRERLLAAVQQFPRPHDIAWYRYDNPLEKKLAMPHPDQLPPIFQQILSELNSPRLMKILERLTGIRGLLPDAEFYGGGLHQIERGGKLDIHADFNLHPKSGLHRRLNLILYLNPDWQEAYGGHLELWDATMTHACARILPILNRLVIFSTTDVSYHGHPEPLQCPPDRYRQSLATYYYSRARPRREISAAHSTLYQRRPQDPLDHALDAFRQARAKGRVDKAVAS